MTLHEPLNEPRVAKLTVDHFMRLDAERAFGEVSKTELIDGVVYARNAQYSRHMRAKIRLLSAFLDVCRDRDDRLEAWSEGAVRLDQHNMPEPDILLTVGINEEGPIERETLRLVIEVSDTTASFDLGPKAAAYARAGVPECWVVDLNAGTVHRLSAPEGGEYRTHDRLRLGGVIESATIEGLEVDTAAV